MSTFFRCLKWSLAVIILPVIVGFFVVNFLGSEIGFGFVWILMVIITILWIRQKASKWVDWVCTIALASLLLLLVLVAIDRPINNFWRAHFPGSWVTWQRIKFAQDTRFSVRNDPRMAEADFQVLAAIREIEAEYTSKIEKAREERRYELIEVLYQECQRKTESLLQIVIPPSHGDPPPGGEGSGQPGPQSTTQPEPATTPETVSIGTGEFRNFSTPPHGITSYISTQAGFPYYVACLDGTKYALIFDDGTEFLVEDGVTKNLPDLKGRKFRVRNDTDKEMIFRVRVGT